MNHPFWLQQKLVEPERVEKCCAEIRSQGLTFATLNGSFDLLHAGHLFILHEARAQADRLFVMLNSDASIQKYKSPERPLIPLQYRLEMIAALACVDYVTWFDETDPCALLGRMKPDVHVNGAEYGENCLEADVVRENGGRLHLVRRIPSLSTTAIIERIKAVCV